MKSKDVNCVKVIKMHKFYLMNQDGTAFLTFLKKERFYIVLGGNL